MVTIPRKGLAHTIAEECRSIADYRRWAQAARRKGDLKAAADLDHLANIAKGQIKRIEAMGGATHA